MRGRSTAGLLSALGILLSLGGCGGGDGGSDSPSGPSNSGGGTAVTVGNDFYSPASVDVATGATVTWTWADGATSHSVTFDDGGDSSPIQSSGTFQRTFSTAGTYTYFCRVHGAAVMHGAVTVGGSSTGGAGAGGGGGSGMGGGGYGGSIIGR